MEESVQNSNPRFSIIIPTYNTNDVLGQCINALSNQTADKKCFEVIVVNDGGKTEVIQDIHSTSNGIDIKYFSQKHKGPAAARNLGINKARGEIILLLDDDSMPLENWLDATIMAWNKSPDLDGIGGYIISEPTDSIYCRVNADFFNWYLQQLSSGEYADFLITCNAGYKKSALNKVGNFDEWFKRAAGEDRDLNIKISKSGGRLRLDKNILVYHDRDLAFRSFVRKNFNYGKAAYNIYSRYPEQKYLSTKGYVAFFVSILKGYKTFEKFIVFFMLTLSQAATIAGYYTSFLSRHKQKSQISPET